MSTTAKKKKSKSKRKANGKVEAGGKTSGTNGVANGQPLDVEDDDEEEEEGIDSPAVRLSALRTQSSSPEESTTTDG